jgi:hypothetical protein
MRCSRLLVVAALAASSVGGARHAAAEPRNTVYVEMLGKGGLWGAGYERHFAQRFAVGVAASFYVVDGERVTSFSPYLGANLLGRGRHRWFAHAGPQVVRVSIPSPVPEWDGTSTTGFGAELSTGWEYRNRVVVRVFGMAAVGEGGVAPWIGVSLGWSL